MEAIIGTMIVVGGRVEYIHEYGPQRSFLETMPVVWWSAFNLKSSMLGGSHSLHYLL
jgi:hypothetical protein